MTTRTEIRENSLHLEHSLRHHRRFLFRLGHALGAGFVLFAAILACIPHVSAQAPSTPATTVLSPPPVVLFSFNVLPGDSDPQKVKLHLSWNISPASATTNASFDSSFILPADGSLHKLPGPLQLTPSCQQNTQSCVFSTDLDLTGPPNSLTTQRGLILSLTVQTDPSLAGQTVGETIDMASVVDLIQKLQSNLALKIQYQALVSSDTALKQQFSQLKTTLASANPTVFWDATGSFQGISLNAISTCAITVHSQLQLSSQTYNGPQINMNPGVKTPIVTPQLPSEAAMYAVSLVSDSQCSGVSATINPATKSVTTLAEPYINSVSIANVENQYLRLTANARNVAFFDVKLQQQLPGGLADIGVREEIAGGENCQSSTLGDCDFGIALPEPSPVKAGNSYQATFTPVTADHRQIAANAKTYVFKGLSAALAKTIDVSFTSTGLTISPTLDDTTVPVTMDVSLGTLTQHTVYNPASGERTLSATINAADLKNTNAPTGRAGSTPANGDATFTVTLTSNDGSGRVQTVPLTITVASPPAGSKAASFVKAAKSTDPTAPASQVTDNPKIELKDLAQSAVLLLLKLVL